MDGSQPRVINRTACLGLLVVGLFGCGDRQANLCADAGTPLSDIQGDHDRSPLEGANVIVSGVVTAPIEGDDRFASGAFIQAFPGASGSAGRSNAVYLVSSQPLEIGQHVGARGQVVELGDRQHTLTAVHAAETQVCERKVTIPAPVNFSPGSNPEPLEGMRVRVRGDLRVADVYNLVSQGQMTLVMGEPIFIPSEIAEPGPAANRVDRENRSRQISIDDASWSSNIWPPAYLPEDLSLKNSPRVGDRLEAIEGVLDTWDWPRIQVVQRLDRFGRRPDPRYSPPPGRLIVGSMNLQNFFNGDGLGGGFPTSRGANDFATFERQQQKLASAVLGLGLPDIIALSELENDGYGRLSAVASLVQAVNARIRGPGTTYDYVRFHRDQLGTDEIAVGLIYRTDKVRPIGPSASLDEFPFDDFNRPPLAQTFTPLDGGDGLTVVAVHLKSKGCSRASEVYADQRDGQGCFSAKRTEAVETILAWLSRDPDLVAEPDQLIVGDFNAYTMEDPMRRLRDAGFVDLIGEFHPKPQYTYIYRGARGRLDHAYASPSLAARASGARIWHINTTYAPSTDVNLPSDGHIAIRSHDNSAIRSSDHDFLAVGF